ncbi:ATP-binding protein [Streptomyces sp. 796.1]|uniref:ATP-binding protein n=1 Tax=Streptomyces sp. 796.1 TaxID=3163029 RepID=UPI0039C928FD
MSHVAAPPLTAATATRLVVPNSEFAPRIMRDLVSTLLVMTGHGRVAGDARACVSELVTNVYCHTCTPLVYLDVSLHPGRVQVTVWDDAWDERPTPHPEVPMDSQGGRGLLLVGELCAEWGVTWPARREQAHKQVWFALDEPAGLGNGG